ncbi:hypothetical protein MTR67_006901 [Solanum verrucosum]|uniref:Armadillo-like repeats domain-containing protein n=1 Tax=Solanum verrucosum TaxID=315347 RepID=A0AAF0PYX9_SOLVR|nr:hypothetical protein MTR67_006901 [Solanum verrucosum]
MSATGTKLLALGGASPRRGHAPSKHNFKLPWQLAWQRLGSFSGTLRVAPGESYRSNTVAVTVRFSTRAAKSDSSDKRKEVLEEEEEEELPWIQEKALDLVEFTGSVTQAIPGPRIGSTSFPWILAVPLTYFGITFVIAFVKTVRKFNSPREKRKKLKGKYCAFLDEQPDKYNFLGEAGCGGEGGVGIGSDNKERGGSCCGGGGEGEGGRKGGSGGGGNGGRSGGGGGRRGGSGGDGGRKGRSSDGGVNGGGCGDDNGRRGGDVAAKGWGGGGRVIYFPCKVTATSTYNLASSQGFDMEEIFRKYIRYSLNEKPFSPDLIAYLIQLRKASMLTDTEVAGILNEISRRIVQDKGPVVMDISGYSEKGLKRKLAVQTLFGKIYYLSENFTVMFTSIALFVKQLPEFCSRDSSLTVKEIFGVADEDAEKLRLHTIPEAGNMDSLERMVNGSDSE